MTSMPTPQTNTLASPPPLPSSSTAILDASATLVLILFILWTVRAPSCCAAVSAPASEFAFRSTIRHNLIHSSFPDVTRKMCDLCLKRAHDVTAEPCARLTRMGGGTWVVVGEVDDGKDVDCASIHARLPSSPPDTMSQVSALMARDVMAFDEL